MARAVYLTVKGGDKRKEQIASTLELLLLLETWSRVMVLWVPSVTSEQAEIR